MKNIKKKNDVSGEKLSSDNEPFYSYDTGLTFEDGSQIYGKSNDSSEDI